jgi:hypothetical protein
LFIGLPLLTPQTSAAHNPLDNFVFPSYQPTKM